MLLKPTNGSSTTIDYKPQLDGLRFLAVFAIIIYHYFPEVHNHVKVIDSSIFLAFFFVLSSYLITKVLLKGKEKGLEAGYPKLMVGFVFLIRRTLRIFPAYYFYLMLVFLFPVGGLYLRENSEMFFFYIANFQIFADQEWNELTSHLWTLAVEEQFYLLWPWLILFLPEKILPKAFLFIIFIGVSSRLLLYLLIHQSEFQVVTLQVLTPTCLDSFGMGAILAYRHRSGITTNPVLKKALVIMATIWVVCIALNYLTIVLLLGRIIVSLFAMVIIEGAYNGYQNKVGQILEHKTVLYLAKISYGIYLYHIFSAFILWKLCVRVREFTLNSFGINISEIINFIAIPGIYFSLSIILTIIMASLSWHFLESPINNLKRFFIYTPSKKVSMPKARKLAKY